MSRVKNFYLGARPKTLYAAVAPVLIGSALAFRELQDDEGNFSVSVSIACLFVSLFLQIGVNYANDYSDGIKGTDENRVGPIRLVGSGLESPKSVLMAMAVSFLVASISGLYVASQSSWWLVGMGAGCILLAWFYTGGKKPYGYFGFGEVVVLLCFGFVATTGTFFALVGSISSLVLIASFIPGMFSMAILLANNIRDIETDLLANKRTLATRLGLENSKKFFYMTFGLAIISTVFVGIEIPLVFVSLILVWPASLILNSMAKAKIAPDYIQVLVMTSKLNLAFAVLVSSLVLSDVVQ